MVRTIFRRYLATSKREMKEFPRFPIDRGSICSWSTDKTVHGFRHYFITHLLKSFDVGTVREFPRHKSLDMIIGSDDKVNLDEKKDKVFGCFETVKVS